MTVKFVPPRVPLVDLRTGTITREWYLLFQAVFDISGTAAVPDDLINLLGPPNNNEANNAAISQLLLALAATNDTVGQLPQPLPPPALIDDLSPPAPPATLIPDDLSRPVPPALPFPDDLSPALGSVREEAAALQSGWRNWTPTFTADAGAFTTVTLIYARYALTNNTVHYSAAFTLTTVGTATGSIRLSLPFTPNLGAIHAAMNMSSGIGLIGGLNIGGSGIVRITKPDATDPIVAGNQYAISGTYEKL